MMILSSVLAVTVLAVYGYPAYTLSITSAEDEVIHLLHDRPQRLLLPHGGCNGYYYIHF